MKKGDLFVGDIRKCVNYYSKSESLYYYIFDFRDTLLPFSSRRFDVIKKRIVPSKDICYEDVLFKKNAILLRLGYNQFIDLDMVNSVFDIYKAIIFFELYDYQVSNIVMPINPYESGSLFVQSSTLRPYFNYSCENEKISIRKILMKKD